MTTRVPTEHRHPVHDEHTADAQSVDYGWTTVEDGRDYPTSNGECEMLGAVVEQLDWLQETYNIAGIQQAKMDVARALTAIKHQPGHECSIHDYVGASPDELNELFDP